MAKATALSPVDPHIQRPCCRIHELNPPRRISSCNDTVRKHRQRRPANFPPHLQVLLHLNPIGNISACSHTSEKKHLTRHSVCADPLQPTRQQRDAPSASHDERHAFHLIRDVLFRMCFPEDRLDGQNQGCRPQASLQCCTLSALSRLDSNRTVSFSVHTKKIPQCGILCSRLLARCSCKESAIFDLPCLVSDLIHDTANASSQSSDEAATSRRISRRITK